MLPKESVHVTGLGVVLVVVVGIGWKCTPVGHEPCHMLFSLGNHAPPGVTTAARRHTHRNRNRTNWSGGKLPNKCPVDFKCLQKYFFVRYNVIQTYIHTVNPFNLNRKFSLANFLS